MALLRRTGPSGMPADPAGKGTRKKGCVRADTRTESTECAGAIAEDWRRV